MKQMLIRDKEQEKQKRIVLILNCKEYDIIKRTAKLNYMTPGKFCIRKVLEVISNAGVNYK